MHAAAVKIGQFRFRPLQLVLKAANSSFERGLRARDSFIVLRRPEQASFPDDDLLASDVWTENAILFRAGDAFGI